MNQREICYLYIKVIKVYQKARKHVGTLRGLFEKVRYRIDITVWDSWYHLGRPEKMNEEQKLLARRLLQEDKSVSEVAKTFNVHKATIYRLSDVTDDINTKIPQ